MKKIGLAYVKGSLPALENFANIPTDLVKSNGLIGGNPISEELDCLIIPGGSILESKSISDDFKNEINKMALSGKSVIGICAGYQLLSNQLDITNPNNPNLNKDPIKKGLSLLDVNFSYLFSNDKVISKVATKSHLTKNLDKVKGFHCHSYGKITGDGKTLFYSPLRVNYSNEYCYQVSGTINDDGNVIGSMIHNILDDNPQFVSNLFDFFDCSQEDIQSIYSRNASLKDKMNKELAIDTDITSSTNCTNSTNNTYGNNIKDIIHNSNSNVDYSNKSSLYNIEKSLVKFKNKDFNLPKFIMISSTESNSGKTFITSGIVGVLKNIGLNVCVLKLGSNIKDVLPSLYLTKSILEDYALIKNEVLENNDACEIFGWEDISKVISILKDSSYDIVLIEGEKSIFDNITNSKFYSTAEIILSSKIPFLLISSCEYGVDYAISDLLEHEKILFSLGLNLDGVILNNIPQSEYNSNEDLIDYFKKQTFIDNVFKIPKIDSNNLFNMSPLDSENRYDVYSILSYLTIRDYMDISKVLDISKEISFTKYYSLEELEFLNKFLS